MQLYLHQTHHSIADFAGIFSALQSTLTPSKKEQALHLFPELFLTGYPLQDLCLERPFITAYRRFLQKINDWSVSLAQTEQVLLLGGLCYEMDAQDFPLKIENVIYVLQPGKVLKKVYAKQLLPNYDIFDEKKYFTAGNQSAVFTWGQWRIGLLICEDMWPSSTHTTNPIEGLSHFLQEQQIPQLDLVINLSASPFHLFKKEQRQEQAKKISEIFQAPFAYVNRVGGEDEVLFDGQSFVFFEGQILIEGKLFAADCLQLSLPSLSQQPKKKNTLENMQLPNTWEGLFSPRLTESHPPELHAWSEEDCHEAYQALMFGLQEYAQKNGQRKFLVALSGGMDSALTLALVKKSLTKNQEVEAIYMPSKYSATLSWEICVDLCQKLQVPLTSLPIKFLHSVCQRTFADIFGQNLTGLSDENIQSRLRGMLIYTRSNQTESLVINTSNKSEIAVGYSTQYGDSVGALSLLGDLFKTEVYALAHFINRQHPKLFTDELLYRAPSAELREDQKDSDRLPPYERLDPILEGLLSYRYDFEDFLQMGFAAEEIKKVIQLYKNSEYKRKQFCPIVKIKAKSFGFGYRNPISKNGNFYFYK